MGINRLKVLVQNPTTGKILARSWSKGELLKSMAWLKRMNARGNDILVQPDEGHALVLIGALTKETLAAMDRHGFEPAVTVETRPGVFQAWVRLATRAASDKALQIASEGLARRFSGKADTTGRLAGFTVHHGPTEPHGHSPFALAHDGQLRGASAGTAYLARVEHELREQIERSRPRQRGPGQSR